MPRGRPCDTVRAGLCAGEDTLGYHPGHELRLEALLAARACGAAAVLRRAGLHISGVYRGCVLRPVRSVPARDAAGGV